MSLSAAKMLLQKKGIGVAKKEDAPVANEPKQKTIIKKKEAEIVEEPEVIEEAEVVEEAEIVEEPEVIEEPKKPEPKAKKTTTKKSEPKKEEIKDNLPAVTNTRSLSVIDEIVKLPSAKDILSNTGRIPCIGDPEVMSFLLSSFLPITYLRLAQAVNNPELAGKIIHGKDDNIKQFDNETPLFLITAYFWERINDYKGGIKEKAITLYFWNPADERVYTFTGTNYATDPIKKLMYDGSGFVCIDSELTTTEFKDKNGKMNKSKFYIPKFERVDVDYQCSEEEINTAINIIQEHLRKFYEDSEGVMTDGNTEDFSDIDGDEIPF